MSTSSGSTSLEFDEVLRLFDRLLARGSLAGRFPSHYIGTMVS